MGKRRGKKFGRGAWRVRTVGGPLEEHRAGAGVLLRHLEELLHCVAPTPSRDELDGIYIYILAFPYPPSTGSKKKTKKNWGRGSLQLAFVRPFRSPPLTRAPYHTFSMSSLTVRTGE